MALTSVVDGDDAYVEDLRTVILDEEFRRLAPEPPTSVQEQMRFRLHCEGCDQPLIVWRRGNLRILLVGHDVIDTVKLYKIRCRIIEKSFSLRADARRFIIDHWVSRHNLGPLAISYLRGRQYVEDRVGPHGGRPGGGIGAIAYFPQWQAEE